MAETTVGREKLMKKLRAAQKKNADARSRENVKPRKGTFADRVKDTAKKAPEKRGLPAKIDKSRGNANKANPPKEIRLKGEGGTGRSLKDAKFKPIPLGDKPKALPSPRPAARTFNPAGAAGRLLGPAGFLVGMTTPTGDGQEDKPSGPLMKGNASKPLSNADVQKSYQELNRKHGTQRPVTEQRRSVPARVKAKPADLMDSYKKKAPKAKPAKPAKAKPAKKAQRVAFKGNWTNAAPTAMQKKAGMRKR